MIHIPTLLSEHMRRAGRRCFAAIPASEAIALPAAPSFMEYRASKLQFLASRSTPTLRLDCMKPQSALSHMLLPLPLFRRPFADTYDVSSIELKKTWCAISGQHQSDQVITKGVRDSLFLLLASLAARCDEVHWPTDVYPVYEKLILKTMPSSIKLFQFETLNGLKLNDIGLELMSKNAVLVLPYPVTPLGKYLPPADLHRLQQWLQESVERRIIFDCVYSYEMKEDWNRLLPLRNSQVAFAFSLAKGWASPFLEPVTAGPITAGAPVPRESFSRGIGFLNIADSSWRKQVHSLCESYHMQPSQYAILKAHWLLTKQPKLPEVFQERFRDQWRRLSPAIEAAESAFLPPSTGYFTSIPQSYVELLQKRSVCAVPASVFGSGKQDVSVVSCLYDIKDTDTTALDKYEWLKKSLKSEEDVPLGDNIETEMYHVTTLSNFIKGYDKYGRVYSKGSISQSTFPDQFFLLLESQLQVGIEKASKLLDKLALDGDALLVLHALVRPDQCELHPRGQFVNQNWVNIKALSVLRRDSEGLEKISIEEAAAISLQINKTSMLPYDKLRPRSVSILPIAKGCQAKCPFCFSKGSVSDDMVQKLISPEVVISVLRKAKENGAERAVITGGGEPMMMPFKKLLTLIEQCSIFNTVCMITNGYYLSQLSEEHRETALLQLDAHGLTVLSVSRHAAADKDNEKIMNLNTESACVATTWARMHDRKQLTRLTRMRWVCVLQKQGVDSIAKLSDYLDFASATSVPEICFKELYVSTSTESLFHDAASNKWSEKNQVPLSLVIDFCENNHFNRISTLPWGAPVYEGLWNGHVLRIAAYTEPSVYWERSNGLCRSWNLMADSSVLASLEDKNSNIIYAT